MRGFATSAKSGPEEVENAANQSSEPAKPSEVVAETSVKDASNANKTTESAENASKPTESPKTENTGGSG
jgi:hypothetical protein